MITRRAFKRGDVLVMDGRGASRATHEIPLPGGVCPFSKEPAEASIEVSYDVDDAVAEVVALELDAVRIWSASSGIEDAAAGIISHLSSAGLGNVRATLRFALRSGQRVRLGW